MAIVIVNLIVIVIVNLIAMISSFVVPIIIPLT